MEFVIVGLLILGFFLVSLLGQWIGHICRSMPEEREYRAVLRESIQKVRGIDLRAYQRQLAQLERLWHEEYKMHKVVLRDKKGKAVSICPKCGNYMKFARKRKRTVLTCVEYPRCSGNRRIPKRLPLEV